jgi:hypothetical protein
MFELVLKFLQPVVSERQEELDAIVGRFGVADLIGLERRQVILLLRWPGKSIACVQCEREKNKEEF